MQQAEAGATEFASGMSGQTSDNPAVGQMSLSQQDLGEWVVSVALTLPGPDRVTGSATLLWHVRVLERATPAPSLSPATTSPVAVVTGRTRSAAGA